MYWCSSSASSPAEAWSWPNGFSTTTRADLVRSGLGQTLHDPAEQERRDLQVEDGALGALDRVADPLVGRGVGEVAVHVRQPLPRTGRTPRVDDLAGALDRLAGALHQLVPRPVVDGHADDRAVQQAARLQPVQRPERHHLRQVAGDPEDHEDVRRALTRLLAAGRCHESSFSSVAAIAVLLSGARRSRALAARRAPAIAGPSSPVRMIRPAGRRRHPLVWVRTRAAPPRDHPVVRGPAGDPRLRLHEGTDMADDQHYDVVIIGTGAGGGTLGHRLATSGAKVLWLERGTFLPRERDNWETQAVFVRGKYLAPEEWYDGHGQEFQPEVNYYVGGNTKFYGAALFRLRPEDFGELRHHGGISPAWPISYDELEPYYTQAEHLYLVHGEHGEDPTEGPASAQYAFPPVSHEPRIQQLSDDLEKLGLHPFHLPIGVNLQEAEPGRRHPGQRVHPLRPGRRLPVPAGRRSRTRRSSAWTRSCPRTTSPW